MNLRSLIGLAAVVLGAPSLVGCAAPARDDGHLFQHWAEAVAAIPIDDGSKPVSARAETQAQAPAPAMKIDLLDRTVMADARAAGLGQAQALLTSEMAGLRRHFGDGESPAAATKTGLADNRSTGGFVARLAAYAHRPAAEAAWARLKAAHPQALSGLPVRFEDADLGAKGVWTRVQAGPFPTQERAAAVCAGAGVADRWCVTFVSGPARS
jgi:hypothetical protein